jgi:hypothetical protein
MTVEETILAFLDSLSGRAPATIIEDARRDVSHGEYGLAIENLCENLFEQDVSLSSAHLAELRHLATDLDITTERWAFVLSLQDRSDEV